MTQLIKELSINSRWGEIEKLKCNRTKATKITVDRFGPKQQGNLVKILQKVKFSLLIDETTDVNLSNRKSTMLLSSIAKSSTESNSKYSLSYSTLSRQRIVHRKNIAERIKINFLVIKIRFSLFTGMVKFECKSWPNANCSNRCDKWKVVKFGST